MRLRISRNNFLDGLRKIQNIVERRQTLPILSNFLLEAKNEGEVEITATDLELGFWGSFPAEVLEPGSIILSAKKSFDILRELPADSTVSLNVEGGNWVRIESGKIRFRIAALPSDDYPSVKEQVPNYSFEIETDSLKDIIAKTIFSTSMEDSRQSISGVLMMLSEDDSVVQLVATDGHRLAVAKRKVEIISSEMMSSPSSEGTVHKSPPQVIIPRRALVELRRVMEGSVGQDSGGEEEESENNSSVSPSHERVRVEIYDGGVDFRKGKVCLNSRALEGPFPEYEYVFPESCNKIIQIDRMMFSQALRRVSLLADDKFKPIILRIREDKMEVLSNTPEMGEAQEEMPVNLQGEEVDIGFNARYLMDVCAVAEGNFIAMELTNAVEAALLRPWEGEGYVCVVMPMRIN